MSMRLAAPAHLVDIKQVDSLDSIEADSARCQSVGATLDATVEHDLASLVAVPAAAAGARPRRTPYDLQPRDDSARARRPVR